MITITRITVQIILSLSYRMYVNILWIHKKYTKYTERICELSALSDLNISTSKFQYVMALRHMIEWDPEEVAAGYDLSSIYEGLGENSTVKGNENSLVIILMGRLWSFINFHCLFKKLYILWSWVTVPLKFYRREWSLRDHPVQNPPSVSKALIRT